MKNQKDHLNIVMVGHLDHGKSTLIGSLILESGTLSKEKIEEAKRGSKKLGKEFEPALLMDCLEEEREQGITIDTTQTFFHTDKRNYCLIDAPGHVEFLKNMITGVSQAEAAILIIDLEQGIREQTQRHAYILSMLGINQVIVVMNKMDLVKFKREPFEETVQELSGFLDSINIKPSYIIPIAAKKGENINKSSKKIRWYKGPTVLEALDTFSIQKTVDRPLRFPVQDVYNIDGEKIIVGRIESGTVRQGQQIIFVPSLKEAEIQSIKIFGQDREEAERGESIGITITPSLTVDRGQIICEKETLAPATDQFMANIFWMSEDPLKLDEKITFRCATQEIECVPIEVKNRINSSSLEILEENAQELHSYEVAEVMFKTEAPIVVENINFVQELGRFVLERANEAVAGGIISD